VAAFKQLLESGVPGLSLGDLKRVSVPRAVVWGAEDSVDSVSAGRRTATALRSSFVLIPRSGHLSMLAQPRAVATAIARVSTSRTAR
jgi:pimeloyl-ACP methyl ester carboxylesterase